MSYNSCCTCCTKADPTCRKVAEPFYAILRVLENIPIIGHLISAFYACAHCKDRAERAGLKATMGLLLAVCNCPAEAVDEMARHRSPKLISFRMTPRPDWMKAFHRRTLRHICMPASHQSATYFMAKKLEEVPLVEGWSRCQDLSIDSQLWGGIRLLDLRVMTYNNEIWTHHQKVICVKFRDILEVVRDFVAENPTEIVFLYITNDGKHVEWMNVHSLLNEFLGKKLIPEHMREMNIGDIVQYGKNIVVAGIPNVAYSWQGIDKRWPNKHDSQSLITDFRERAAELRNYNPYFLFWYKCELTANSHTIIRSLGGLPSVCVSSCAIEKFDFQEDAAACVNHKLLEELQGEELVPFNFISTDFVNDEIMDRILALNTQELTGAGPVAYREVLAGSRDNLLTEVRVDRSFAIMDSSTLERNANFSRQGTLERGASMDRGGTLDRNATLDRTMDRSMMSETGRTEPRLDLYKWQRTNRKRSGAMNIRTPSDPVFTIA